MALTILPDYTDQQVQFIWTTTMITRMESCCNLVHPMSPNVATRGLGQGPAAFPRRLRASGRDGETVMTESPSPLRMLLSRHTRRRDLLALSATTLAFAWGSALAQVSPHRPLIAMLLGGSQTTVQQWLGGFPEGLRALGYVEHRDYEIEYRY